VLRCERVGLADNWLRHVQDVREKHQCRVDAVPGEAGQHDRLCELNVIEQVANVCQTTIVQDAWARGQSVTVHGWIYGLKDGLLRNLNTSVANAADLPAAQAAALAAL